MQVNFTRDEYIILRELADYYSTTPAWMVHDWVMDHAAVELLALKEAKRRVGSWDGNGSSNPIPRSNAIEPGSKGS